MNLRTFDKYESLKFTLSNVNGATLCLNHALNLPVDNTFIMIDNLLSSAECAEIISKTNNYYTDLEMEYLPTERDSKRLLNMNNEMTEIIYERIKIYVEKEHEKLNLKPFGFGVEGKWQPFGINPCFRHSVYNAPSIGFKPHRDSCYIENADIRSVLTIIIYLNGNFDGGETVFIKPNSDRIIEQTVDIELKNGYEIIHKIVPSAGKCVIFNHNVIHAGLDVYAGSKYIVRSDILFKRVEWVENNTWKENELFLKAIEYYREANNQEMKGNVVEAGKLYELGLSLRQFH